MKKIVSTCLVLILLALFSATFYCSRRTEAAFRRQVENLRQNESGFLKVRLDSYRTGLFLSQAGLSILLDGAGTLRLRQQIRHFPWGVEMVTQVAGDSDLASELTNLVPLDQVLLLTRVDLHGRSHSTLGLPEWHFSDDSGELKLSGLNLVFDLDQTLSSGDYSLDLGTLSITVEGERRLELSGMTLQGRVAGARGLPLGEGELRIARIELHNSTQPDLDIKDLRNFFRLQLTGESLAGLTETSMGELLLLGERFTKARFKLSLRGLEVAAIQELQESLRQLQADLLSREVDPLILQMQMLGVYSQLLQGGLDLRLEQFDVQGEEGTLQGEGTLQLLKTKAPGTSGTSPEQVTGHLFLNIDHGIFASGVRALDRLQHQGRASANRGVLNEQAEQLAGALLQKGILTNRQGGGYRVELAFDRGQGWLNGRSLNP